MTDKSGIVSAAATNKQTNKQTKNDKAICRKEYEKKKKTKQEAGLECFLGISLLIKVFRGDKRENV